MSTAVAGSAYTGLDPCLSIKAGEVEPLSYPDLIRSHSTGVDPTVFGALVAADGQARGLKLHQRVLRRAGRAAFNWPAAKWASFDLLLAFGGFVLANLTSWPSPLTQSRVGGLAVAACAFAVLLFCLNYAAGTYDRQGLASVVRTCALPLLPSLLATSGVTLATAALAGVKMGWTPVSSTFLLTCGTGLVLRISARGLAARAKLRVAFVGRRHKFRALEREIRRVYGDFYHRPIYVDVSASAPGNQEQILLRYIRRCLPDQIIVEDADEVILNLVNHSSAVVSLGCEIHTLLSYSEDLLQQVPENVSDSRAILGRGFRVGRCRTELAKRATDIVLATVGLLVGIVPILICAVLVKLTSRGPVIYKQIRMGRFGRNFCMYKLRTMRHDAEKDGPVWAKAGDARVTGVGRMLRKTRLDELPQLWNILRGDMSFVGPRPERPEIIQRLRRQIPQYDLRHLVPPGLTGLAQLRYHYGASVKDARRKLAFDLYYIRHYSILLDLAICLRTPLAMVRGAR